MTSYRTARRLRSAEDERGSLRDICPTNLYRASTHVGGTTTTTNGDAGVSTTSASSTASTTTSGNANGRVITTTTSSTSTGSSSSSSSSSTAATTTTTTTTIRTVTTTCYCHCPSGRGTLKDADLPSTAGEVDGSSCSSCSPPSWILNCDVCERLHGRADEDDRRRPEMARRFGPNDAQRGSSSSASWIGDERDLPRDLPRDPSFLPPTSDANRHGPSTFSKYASSVVRWTSREDVCRTSCRVRWPSQWCVFTWSVLFLLLLTSSGTLGATFMDPSTSPAKKDGVCQSIDIRSSVNEFARLEGCRVVEGFVQILLIDEQHANSSSYADLTFPDLLEITGYLVLYRVNGLKSIGHLFPNLTVIRGHSLFINYALVAFEMMHLQEIGLHSLTDIQKGSVRFEKNPALCYVDTIDWDQIAKNGKGEHVISENKAKNVCPVCKSHCPLRLTKPDERLCWNGQHCQKVCNCGGNACMDEKTCCHSLCLGSCSGETDQDCKVCKEVIVEGNRCAQSCGNGTFEFLNRRCVREDECRRMKKPREAGINVKSYSYKPFNGTCVLECPPGYMDVERNGKSSCQKCEGPCLKECVGGNIDSIASAQKLRGCTHITGSLQIQIRGGKNIVKELEDNLHTIEEINGYLKIVRSFPLISLNFLKNLRVIRGNELDYAKYTLAVLDNQNLQELWDWDAHGDLKILSKDGPAKVFFHFNSKLCIHQIEMLRKRAGLAEFTDFEVAPNSNGDKVACNVTELKITLLRESSRAALIIWEAFDHYDPRALLGYMVYIIEAPHQNVTMYDGRDACGGDGWRVDDVPTLEPSNVSITVNDTETKEPVEVVHILTKLKPYTQYAFYVKTYTIATERSGAQSKVMYFTTKPDAPSAPRALTTWSNSSSELVISWLPPLRKNGNLIHYLIFGKLEDDDPDFTAQRNYCDEPMLLPEKKPLPAEEEKKIRVEEEKDIAKLPDAESCKCTDRESDQSIREKEVSSSIAFEDALHNKVYVKRVSTRRRRDVDDVLSPPRKGDMSDKESQSMNKTVNEKVTSFERKVSSANLTYVIKNLRHFGAYNIEVQACREKVPNDTSNSCSTKSMRTHRTLPLQSADDIPPDSFRLSISQENNSLSIVTLTWDEPKEPNGLIVAYQIEYKRIDIQDIKPTVVCITRQNFKEAGKVYVLKNLSTGNYSAKVRATSLAGNGNYSDVIHFYIEEYTKQQTYWIFIGSTFFILMIVTLIPSTYYLWRWKIMKDVPNRRLIATVNPEYVSSVPFAPDEWEVPRSNVELLGELGTGSFGMVYEGLCKGLFNGETETRCAVKTVNNNATDRERIEFLNEASVMKYVSTFNSYHVVKLLGVVTRSMPPLVIMELMKNGDLKSYLRSHRPEAYSDGSCKQPPTLKRILQMATEIADGMCYLAAKKFVHRDLAARNCMVAEDLTVKVGDFGMTRDVYETDYYRKGSKGLLPVRWMAPESLKDGVFSSFSDVWSYGVVLWEMVTLASQPYQGMTNDGVLRYVIGGGTMERPENCPDALYNLMKRTWRHRASRRPTFIDIATILLHDCYSETFEKVSFFHSPQGIESRNQNSTISQIKWTATTTLNDLADNFDDYADDVEEMNHDYNRMGSFYAESDEDEPLQGEFTELGSSPVRYGRAFLSLRCKIPSFHNLNSYGTSTRTGVTSKSLGSIRQALNLPFLCSTVDKTITRSIPNYENRKPGVLSMSFPRHNFPFMDSVEDIVVDAVDGLTELDTVDNNSDDTINDDKSETNSVLEMNGNE